MTDTITPHIKDYFNSHGPDIVSASSRPVVEVNFHEFLEHTKDCDDLSEDEQIELIQIYWNIAMEFVKIGYGLHPVQCAARERSSCGKAAQDFNLLPAASQDMLYLEDDKTRSKLGSAVDAEPEGGTL